LNDEIPDQIRGLERTLMSFVTWSELGPRHQTDILQWDGPPTPLATRQISGPDHAGSGCAALLIALYRTRRAAELASGSRAIDGRPVDRLIVELEARSLDVIDARTMDGLNDRALLDKDPRAWKQLRMIREHFGGGAIWIARQRRLLDAPDSSTTGSAAASGVDLIVLFADSIDQTMFVRDEAIYRITATGEARLLGPIDAPEPQHKPRARWLAWNIHRAVAHIVIALVAALFAHPALELVGELVGVTVTVPAVIPALVGLGIGAALARPVIRRLRAGRKAMANVLEVAESHALLMTRLDELQRGEMGGGARPPEYPASTIDGGDDVDATAQRPKTNAVETWPPVSRARTTDGLIDVNGIAGPTGTMAVPPISGARTLGVPVTIALLVAVVAYPAVELAGEIVGFKVVMPAVIPALVALGIGAAVAFAITRRLRRYGEVVRNVLDLPDNYARLMNRLDTLQRNNGNH